MKKNTYLYICIGILVVFTIAYFIAANSISYAFVNNDDSYLYDHKINEIKIASINYLNLHEDAFSESETIYIVVDDLVKEGLLEADMDGKVRDPQNEIKTLNGIKIRLTKLENGYDVKVLS